MFHKTATLADKLKLKRPTFDIRDEIEIEIDASLNRIQIKENTFSNRGKVISILIIIIIISHKLLEIIIFLSLDLHCQ